MIEKRIRTGIFVGVFLVISTVSLAAAEPSPLGFWARGDGKARVRIERCPGGFCAINTWIKSGTPDEKAGDHLVLKVEHDSPTTLIGDAFDPQRNQTFRIQILTGDNSMTTRGCVFVGMLCKEMTWSRIEGATQ